jgi:predicted double-glycine peptidase
MNRRCRQLLLVCVSLLALSGCDPTPNPSPRVVRSMLEERRDDVVIQKWDISCGAAALATLLTYDQGYQVTEREVAAGMLHFTTVNRVRAQLGFSLLDLKRFAESRGFTADGYGNMTLRDLVETGPAIVPVVLRGYNHFVVFRGIQGDRVLLADPAWGNRTMQIPYFMNIWESRVAFAVNRNGGKRVHRLEANATDFWASSTTFEAPVRKIVVAKLMDEPPAKAQMMVAETSSPLAQTAAGPGGASANSALPDNDQPAVVVTGRTKTVAGATEARAPRSATGTNIVVAAVASPAGIADAAKRQDAAPNRATAAARAIALEQALSATLHRMATRQMAPETYPVATNPQFGPLSDDHAPTGVAPEHPKRSTDPDKVAAEARAVALERDVEARIAQVSGRRAERVAVSAAMTPQDTKRETTKSTAARSDPAPGPAAQNVAPRVSSVLLAEIIKQADVLIGRGDISAARLFYERAAQAGSGQAATAVGRTFDPNALARMGAIGTKPDPTTASLWYRQAIALGDSSAEPLLRALAPAGGA